MERQSVNLLKFLVIALVDLFLIALTVLVADAAKNYILKTIGYLPSLTYSFIGLLAALMFIVFLYRLDSKILKAMGLAVPFTAFFLFLQLVLGKGHSLIAVLLIVSGAAMMTFLKLRSKSILYSLSILLIMAYLIYLDASGTDLILLLKNMGFSLY